MIHLYGNWKNFRSDRKSWYEVILYPTAESPHLVPFEIRMMTTPRKIQTVYIYAQNCSNKDKIRLGKLKTLAACSQHHCFQSSYFIFKVPLGKIETAAAVIAISYKDTGKAVKELECTFVDLHNKCIAIGVLSVVAPYVVLSHQTVEFTVLP